MNHFTFPSSASTAFARKQQQLHQDQRHEIDEDNNVNLNGTTDTYNSFPRRSPNIPTSSKEPVFDFTAKDQLLSPISNHSPWNQQPSNNGHLQDVNDKPFDQRARLTKSGYEEYPSSFQTISSSRTPPDMGLFYNRAANTPSPSNQKAKVDDTIDFNSYGTRGANMIARSGSNGIIGGIRNSNRSSNSGHANASGFYSAGGGMRLAPAMEDDVDDDRLFFQRDSTLLPRRNHTIALGSSKYGKRLERQFPPFPATSPGKNSLSAITGGKEDGDDDWEAMLKRKESLIPNDDEESEVLDYTAWQPMSLNSSSHKRFPSQPISTLGTSPIDSHHSPVSTSSTGAHSSLHHQRSESAHASSLAQGPFASSPIIPGSAFGSNTGIVRRHQSLNYHAGRQMSNRMNQGHKQEAIGSGAKVHSPVYPLGSDEQSPNHSPNLLISNTRSQNGPQFQSKMHERDAYENVQDQNQLPHSSTQLSSSLMDAHAQMERLSLFNEKDANAFNSQKQTTSSEVRPKLPSLITSRDVLARSRGGQHEAGALGGGPASASAYVPPIGHGHHRQSSSNSITSPQFTSRGENFGSVGRQNAANYREPQTAFPATQSRWQVFKNQIAGASIRSPEQKDDGTPTRTAQPHGGPWVMDPTVMRSGNLRSGGNENAVEHVMNGNDMQKPIFPIASDILKIGPNGTIPMFNTNPNLAGLPTNSNEPIRLGGQHPHIWNNLGQPFATPPPVMVVPTNAQSYIRATQNVSIPFIAQAQHQVAPLKPSPSPLMDPQLSAIIASKGYNPPITSFNVDPPRARFFVIKSFTEDDVQRSLKHEIWASTEKGNQRLDRAFKESSQDGPLYLLFSVNASGHFCGVAEMLTSIDFSSDSNVWVQEGKWKGTFKVRWIYVKDVPNNKLRHIRLTNTAECKPITQSRDTQELPPDGGRQALKIIAEYQSRTTLLQDWLFYETQAEQQQTGDRISTPPQAT